MSATDTTTPLSIAVVVNNYNYGRFLRAAIDGVLSQTRPADQFIVVDDGSSDDSLEIIRSYGDRFHSIIKQNGGQASTFNAALEHVTSDVVIFCDSDDFLHPNALQRIADVWQPGWSKLHYPLDKIDEAGNAMGRIPMHGMTLDTGDVIDIYRRYGRYNTMVSTGNAFSTKAIRNVIPIPEDEFVLCADGYLSAVTPFFGPVAYVDEALGVYRQHSSNRFNVNPSSSSDVAGKALLRLENEIRETRHILRVANACGKELPVDFDMRARKVVMHRILAYRLAHADYPISTDTPLYLFRMAMRSLWRTPRISVRQRVRLTIWATLETLTPAPLARRLAMWHLAPSTRPHWPRPS